MRLHEHGVFARFRYNDLKEAAHDLRRTRALCKFNGWEGAATSCTEAVLQSATRDCMRPEPGRSEKGS